MLLHAENITSNLHGTKSLTLHMAGEKKCQKPTAKQATEEDTAILEQ